MNNFNNREVLRAIMKGDLPSLEVYFSNGLSSNALTAKERWSLLHQATVLVGKPANTKAVGFLLQKGVPINTQDIYGNLPLHYSVRNSDITSAKLLIEYGSDVNVLNHEGISPLHQILLKAPINIELVQLLLAHGASTTLGTVSEFAKAINNSSINEAFEQYGN